MLISPIPPFTDIIVSFPNPNSWFPEYVLPLTINSPMPFSVFILLNDSLKFIKLTSTSPTPVSMLHFPLNSELILTLPTPELNSKLDIPYIKGVNYITILDGFIISDNIVADAENIDADFMYSDHNPVKLTFKLK